MASIPVGKAWHDPANSLGGPEDRRRPHARHCFPDSARAGEIFNDVDLRKWMETQVKPFLNNYDVLVWVTGHANGPVALLVREARTSQDQSCDLGPGEGGQLD